jgi:hypothetical protein
MTTTHPYAALAAALIVLLAGCGDDTASEPSGDATSQAESGAASSAASPPAASPVVLPSEIPTPHLDPADFVDGVDNPYLPLVPGTRWVYDSRSPDGNERIVVTVTDRTKTVDGVTAVVVHDRATTPGDRLLEDTYDWYAQDTAGNVWYLGEDTTAYEDGKKSKEGSWEAGVDGAMAGVAMPAHPRIGDHYAQEYYEGEAEDEGEVLALDATADVPFGSYTDLVKTRDTTPLEPGLVEHKYYARGVGVVQEETVRGGKEHVSLVSMTTP